MSGDEIAVWAVVNFVHVLAIKLDKRGALRKEDFAFILGSCLDEPEIQDHAPTKLMMERIVHLLAPPDNANGSSAGWKPEIIKGGKS